MLALIPLLPFAGFLVNAFFGKRLSKSFTAVVSPAAMTSFVSPARSASASDFP